MLVNPAFDRDLKALFFKALLLRALAAVAIHAGFAEEVFAPDQTAYHAVASSLVSYWSGETFFYDPRFDGSPKGYFFIVAIIYYVLGATPLIPKLVNAVVGALMVPVLCDLALRVTGRPSAALRAAKYVAYFPSLVLWSALNIRDAWIILLIVLICREALVLQERFGVQSLFLLGVSVFAITQFRSYILFPVTLPVVLSFFVRRRANLVRNTIVGMLAAGAVIYSDQAAGSGRQLRTLDFEQLQEMRYWNTVGAASGFEQADISTPTKALMFLPKGLALFLLAPFPWMLGSIRQILAVPETLFFYSLMPSIFRGLRYLIRERLGVSLMIILLSAGMTLGYALGEGNAGTAYRHRAQMLPCYLIFAAIGYEMKRRPAHAQETPFAAPARL